MIRVSWCESHWNPRAHNPSGANGLFQFMSGTWQRTPYGRKGTTLRQTQRNLNRVWQAKWASLGAAWAWRQGWQGQWACR